VNKVTFASNYGKLTEVYNGVDFNVSARLARGAQLSGGANIGNAYFPVPGTIVSSLPGQALTTNVSATNWCFVVDSPQQLYQCKVTPPYQARIKLNGSYPLPGEFQVSAVFQSIPGPTVGANYSVSGSQTTLGRNLTTGTAIIAL